MKHYVAILVAGLAWLASGCIPGDAPTIVSLIPGKNATGVSVNTIIAVTFDQPMNDTSLENGIKLKTSDNQPVAVEFRYQGEGAVLVPRAPLKHDATYRVTVAENVVNTGATSMDDEVSYTFKTEPASAADDAVIFVGPVDFSSGRATVDLGLVTADERIMVIPVHATQEKTRTFSTDGFDFSIAAEGLTGVQLATAAAPVQENIKPTKSRLRHGEGFKERWDSLKKLTYEQKEAANAVRVAAGSSYGHCVGPYDLGKQCTFKVSDYRNAYTDVTATLRGVSANAYFFVDNNDLDDFSDDDMEKLGWSVDNVSVPSDRKYFGELPDTDLNGKVIVVLTRVLIDPVYKTGAFGYVDPSDLFPNGTTSWPSNEGDIFYAATPSRVQYLGYSRSEYFNDVIPETMTHELKHLIALGERLPYNRDAEELWLEEPSAVAAEELAGFGSSRGGTQEMAFYALMNPAYYRVVWDRRPSSSEEYAMYGYNFLFLWRVAEKMGQEKFWKSWITGPGTGIGNLETHTGVTFTSLMQDWAVVLGFDHTGYLANYNYGSLNLRDGSWRSLGTGQLGGPNTWGTVRSSAYYVGIGTGTNVTLELRTSYSSPYFAIVRYPAF